MTGCSGWRTNRPTKETRGWATIRRPVNMGDQLRSVIALTGTETTCKVAMTEESRSQQVIDNASPCAMTAHERIVFSRK